MREYGIGNLQGIFGSPVPAWHPSSLFGASDIGGCWDLTNMSTLYQDVAMTTPVTAAEQSVNRANDISGKGQDIGGTTPMIFKSAAGLNWCENSTGFLPSNLASNLTYPITMMVAGDTTGLTGVSGVIASLSDAANNDQVLFAVGILSSNTGPGVAVYNSSYTEQSCGQSAGKFVNICTFKTGSQQAVDHNGNASAALNISCPSSLNDFTLGGMRRGSGNVAYVGKYACALLINRELTAEEKTNLINWAKAKAGIM